MLYYKIINGQEVFNPDSSLKVNGRWISNPSPEIFAENGWQPYTPPPVIPSPQEEPDYEQVLEAVKKMLSTEVNELSDVEALEIAALYQTWRSKLESGEDCVLNERLWYDGKLWKVSQPHTPQEDWNPRDAVSLFAKVSIEEWPEIPENIPAEAPWMAGRKGTWHGRHYICQIDNCVWSPDQYPAAWIEA